MRSRLSGITVAAWRTLLIFTLIPLISALAQPPPYRVDSVQLTVYRDGLIHVVQTLTVNETYPSIVVDLLSPSVENVIAIDENETFLDYEAGEKSITIFTLGAKKTIIEYDTMTLTRLEAGVWTLVFDTPYTLTAYFPEESTIIYLSEAPSSISVKGDITILQLYPGTWEISYVLPIIPPTPTPTPSPTSPPPPTPPSTPSPTPTPTPTLTPTPTPPPTPLFPLEYLVAAVGAVVLIAIFLVLRRRSPGVEDVFKRNPDLSSDERRVIQYIFKKGGGVWEAEVRDRFDLPRTSVWRMARRLEDKGIIVIKKIGLQNRLELKRR